MLSQHTLAERWRNGATSGEASNVRITRLTDDWIALVAYDTHVLAVKTPIGTVGYAGWYQQGISTHSGAPSIKNMFSRMNLWRCDVVVSEDMTDDRRAISGDMRATRLSNQHDGITAPTVADFY